MSKGLTVGLIGCGRWGKNILRDLVSLGCNVAVAAACGNSQDNARRGGADLIVEDFEYLPPCAGIVVATPASTHAQVLNAVLPRGVPIFCEKPLTTDVASARLLAEIANGRLFVMHKWRYHPGVEALATIARSGELGELRGLKTSRRGPIWQEDVDCTWTLLPHELTIALEMLGQVPKPRQVVAELGAGGTVQGLIALLGEKVWHLTAIGGPALAQTRTIEAVFSGGRAFLPDAYSDHLLISRASKSTVAEKRQERRPISTALPLLAELSEFVNYLQGGSAPRSSVLEAVAVVEAIAEIRRLAGVCGDHISLPSAA